MLGRLTSKTGDSLRLSSVNFKDGWPTKRFCYGWLRQWKKVSRYLLWFQGLMDFKIVDVQKQLLQL